MRIPLSYIARNLWTRKLTTLLTAGGMALVVFVYAAVLMLEAGLRQTLVQTGSDDNVVVIRKASQTEVQSAIDRSQSGILESLPYIANDAQGRPLVSKEVMVLISLPKRSSGLASNVVIRGSGASGLALRPQVRLYKGRMFHPGSSEIIVGRAIAEGFKGAELGERLRFAQRDWTVVGIFDAGRTGFNSEIWGDAEQMLQAFRRPIFSSLIFRLRSSQDFPAVTRALDGDPRLTVEAKRETRFYADQSEALATFIHVLGVTLSVIFSIGAIIGATITMYAAVANRVGEIGTLRALGFPRRSVLLAFLIESLMLGGLGGVVGLAVASGMQSVDLSTTNFQTFAEIAFSFTLTPGIVIQSLIFALFMGFVGGFLPAARAARMNIVDALRAA